MAAAKYDKKYDPDFPRQVSILCRLGAVNNDLAEFFQCSLNTLLYWRRTYPEFDASMSTGKDCADFQIVNSLFHRAKGYSHRDTHISNFRGHITQTEIEKHYPPDTMAAMFWLRNRMPDQWKNSTIPPPESDEKTINPDAPVSIEDARKIAYLLSAGQQIEDAQPADTNDKEEKSNGN